MRPLVGVADGRGATVAGDDIQPLPQAFDAFYAAEYRSVLAFAASLCHDIHAAEDLTQEAFIAAQRRWDSLQGFDRPELWVRRVVANRSVSRWRRLVSDGRRAQRLADAARMDRDRDGDTRRDDIDVWRLVRELPPRQAQVIALTYLEDRPLADVAAVLGIGVETAKTHLQRGRAALARAIRMEADPEDER